MPPFPSLQPIRNLFRRKLAQNEKRHRLPATFPGLIEPLESRIAPASLLAGFQVASAPTLGSIVAGDGQGGVIVAGNFASIFPVGGGHGPLTSGDPAGDLFIIDYSATGAVKWATTWGGTGPETANAIVVDPVGEVYVTGSFASSNAGFPGTTANISANGSDVFLIKLNGSDGTPATAFNGSGQLRWGGTDSGPGAIETGLSVNFDSAGSIIVSGMFSSPDAGFDSVTTVATKGGEDAFVFKVNSGTGAPNSNFGTGGTVAFGGLGFDSFTRVLPDSNTNLILGYETSSSPGSAPGLGIVKLNNGDGTLASAFGPGGIIMFAPRGAASGSFDIGLDYNSEIVVAIGTGKTIEVSRYDAFTAAADSSFGKSGVATLGYDPASPIQVNIDHSNAIYVSGNYHGSFLLSRINGGGIVDPTTLSSATIVSSVAIDSQDNLLIRGIYSGNADLDPTNTKLTLTPRSPDTLQGLAEGYVVQVDPYGVNAGNPLNYVDVGGLPIQISLTGPGTGHATLENFGSGDSLHAFTFSNTTLASSLSIKPTSIPTTAESAFIDNISTTGANQSIGSITLGFKVVLSQGEETLTPNLHVSGQLNALTVDGLQAHALIELGDGLSTADTFNNHPTLNIGGVLASGVEIDVFGGLGNVTIKSWNSPGIIKTLHSIGNFTVQQIDVPEFGLVGGMPFEGVLDVGTVTPSPHLALVHAMDTPDTDGNAGNIDIENGAWGSSGSEIQGHVASFSAQAFLAGASITAGSIGSIKMTKGEFAGQLTLTDTGAKSAPTFTVNTDFTGVVVSQSPLKKIKIKGNFSGSLEAPGIAGISAYAFLGTASNDQMNPYPSYIHTGIGALGSIKATAGIIENYELKTSENFAGITVNAKGLLSPTSGLDNVNITAASIGNISVHLAAKRSGFSGSTGTANLIGINNSVFTTTGTGTVKGAIGSIGNISVAISGAPGVSGAVGIVDSEFNSEVSASTVNPVGKISVKVAGAAGESVGLRGAEFEGNFIGATKISVASAAGGTAIAIQDAIYTADKTIGAISISGAETAAAVTGLKVYAGGAVGAITVRSSIAANGSLNDSAILAGQNLNLTGITDSKVATGLLKGAALGAISLSGSLSGSTIAAGSNVGTVAIGGSADSSYILAGTLLGSDHEVSADDHFQRTATISGVTVKGNFASTSIDAGIDLTSSTLGDAAGPLTTTSHIGAISLGSGALLTLSGAPMPHAYVIEAASIAKLVLPHTPPVTSFANPVLIDTDGQGEDAASILVQAITTVVI